MSKEQTNRKTELQLASDRVKEKNKALQEAEAKLDTAKEAYTVASTVWNKASADCREAEAYVDAAKKALTAELKRMQSMTVDLVNKVNE